MIPDVAHPEVGDAEALSDLKVSESRFIQMKAKHDSDKEDRVNMKLIGKTVSAL